MADTVGTHNYYIGKGVVYFSKNGGPFRDMGNATEIEFTPAVEQLDHFSSRHGVREKDRTVVLQKSGTLRLVLEEWMIENLALAVLGDVVDDSDDNVINIFSSNAISGSLKFKSTNEVGPKFEWHFLKVDFIPGAALGLITDEWGPIELSGEVAAVDGVFGTITRTAEEGDTEGTETEGA